MTVSLDPINILQRLIRIPSCDPPGGELAVAQLVHDLCRDIGLSSHLDEFEPGRANVIARVPGQGTKPALVFSAHLDTVPTGDLDWSFDPFAGDLVGDRVRGRGASDMKSAVAAFLVATARLARCHRPLQGDVILALTAGESANCLGARRLVAQGFQDEIGAFMCGEPSSLDLVTVEKNILWMRAEARGRVGHVSGDPGENAISSMMCFLTRLRQTALMDRPHPLLSPASVSVGRIGGGSAVNLTPDLCWSELDVRFSPGTDPNDILAQLEQIGGDGIALSQIDFKPAVEEPADSAFLVCCTDAVEHVTGRSPARLGVPYYSDAAILLDGLDVPFAIVGPGDLGMSGQPNESVSATAVRQAVRIFERIAEKWLS